MFELVSPSITSVMLPAAEKVRKLINNSVNELEEAIHDYLDRHKWIVQRRRRSPKTSVIKL